MHWTEEIETSVASAPTPPRDQTPDLVNDTFDINAFDLDSPSEQTDYRPSRISEFEDSDRQIAAGESAAIPAIPAQPLAATEPTQDSTVNTNPAVNTNSAINTGSAANTGSTNDRPQIEALWRDSIQYANGPLSTLKGPAQEQTVSDTVFSIQPRALRAPNVEPDPENPVDYELLEIIGQGGVGVVYAGRQASIDRTVAIKMLRDDYRHRQDHRDKFLAEAVLTGELDHPNIVPIYDLGRSTSGELFYSMKNVVGTPWDRVIGTKSLRENLDILLKVADAVAFAHSRGVIHRDLKPENVMLGSFGEVLVMDWGIALPTAEFRKSASILRSQAMGGTPAYMAPEMAKGSVEKITQSADVYLLGAILFEILTGRPPHYGHDVMNCLLNAAENLIVETDVTGELMEIANKSMSTVPRRRYRSVQDFQAAIRLYQSHSDSITLSDNAEIDLAEAINNKSYQKFSRATFAFEEALSMWAENTLALEGLKRSTLAHAQAALEKGDVDLGLSLLSETDPEHHSLIGKLKASERERMARQTRLRLFKRVAVALTAFIVTAGSIAITVILNLLTEASQKQLDLERAQIGLKNQVELANKATAEAETQKESANRQSLLADAQRRRAEEARQNAELARLESVAQKQKAEESSYFAEAGLVGASIEQNGFTVAAEVLDRQTRSAAKSKLRHWEWGRYRYLIQGGRSDIGSPVVSTHTIDVSVEALDVSADGQWIAVGLSSGECQLWQADAELPTLTFRHGKTLRDLDFDPSGQWLLTCGSEDEQTGSVKVWQMPRQGEPVAAPKLEQTISLEMSVALTAAFSNDPQATYLVVGDDRRVGHVWKWREPVRTATLLGHMDEVTAVRFSPDNRWVGTASLDGAVRLFDAQSGSEVQRFNGHKGAVLCLAFTTDGRQVASAGAQPQILVWDVDPTHDEARRLADVRRQVQGEELPAPKFISFQGHTGSINDVRFSVDGQYMLSAGNDNCVYVWRSPTSSSKPRSSMQLTSQRRISPITRTNTDAADAYYDSGEADVTTSNQPLMRLRGHGGWIRSCCFSYDNQYVYSGALDRSWRRWRIADYSEQLLLGDRHAAITDAHYAPNGETVATAYEDGTLALWNTTTGQSLGLLSEGHEYLTNRAHLSSDGTHLITAAGDNSLRVWDIDEGSEQAVLKHAGNNAAFAVSRDGQWLVAAGDEQGVCVCDLPTLGTQRRMRTQEAGAATQTVFAEPSCVAISDGGEWIFVGNKNGSCEFWNARDGQLVQRVSGHADSVVAAFVLPNTQATTGSASVLTVSADGTAAWWNVADGKEARTSRLRHGFAVQTAALSSDGRFLATAATLDRGGSRLWLWDVTTGQQIATRDLDNRFVQEVSLIPSTSDVLVTTSNLANSRKEIWQWTPANESWKPVGSARVLNSSIWGATITNDGTRLLTYGGKGARLFRLSDNAELMHFRPSASVYCLDYSSDSQRIAAGNEDGSITIWNSRTLKSERKLLGGHKFAVLDLAFSADDRSLVSTGADGKVVLWDVAAAQAVASGQIAGRGVRGNSVKYSPDGQTLVIACDDQRIRVHDARSLTQLFRLEGHADAVSCAEFSPDGQWIASGGHDKTIRLWSVALRQEVTKLIGHLAPIRSVGFSHDGLRLISSSQDSSVKLWDLDNLEQMSARLAQPASDSPTVAVESEAGEIMSLNYHTGATTSAEFSPRGQDVLTAGADGLAVIWPAERVPPALRLSKPSLSYKPSDPMLIDPMARISQPDTNDLKLAKFSLRPAKQIADTNADLKTEDDDSQLENISLDMRDGMFSVARGKLYYHAPTDESIEVGEILQPTPNSLEISFGPSVTFTAAQQLIRHLAYQRHTKAAESADDADTPSSSANANIQRSFELSLTDHLGRSANSQPETLIIQITQQN
ncbi:MAG: protein kinase [Pirellulaceae bacterium]|nr:protein kinase [Pirellulaceae bacterium]